MVNFNGFACVPACIGCRQADDCAKARQVPINETVQVRSVEWAPNRLPYITLPCGCRDIPWPILLLARSIAYIECDIHGSQNLSKYWKEQAERRAKKLAEEAESPDTLDIPPF